MLLRPFPIRASRCLVLIFLLALTPPAARGQVFQGIPPAPGYRGLDIRGVSADGEVVFGTAYNYALTGDNTGATTSSRGFRWENGEMTLLSPLSGHEFSEAYGASADGSVIVGISCESVVDDAGCRGVKWTGTVATMLPFMSGDLGDFYRHYAFAVSADGSVIAGHLYQDGDGGPVRWSSEGPAFAAPLSAGIYDIYPQAVSSDGSVIAGARWRPRPMMSSYHSNKLHRLVGQALFPLTLPAGADGSVMGISGDGAVIVGAVRPDGSAGFYPAQWGPDGYEELALPDSAMHGEAYDASHDGSVVVGTYYTQRLRSRTAIWRDGVFSDLQWELDQAGVDLGESGIAQSVGISADGTVVVGRESGSPEFQGFRLKLPLRLVVNDTGDEPDADAGDGKCDTDPAEAGMQCTLRAAIQEANAAGSDDPLMIGFDIAGDGVPLITLGSPLPPVLNTTQIGNPGTRVNLEGGGLESGLILLAPNSAVEGLAFTGFVDGVTLMADGMRVRSCSFGRRWLGDRSDATLEIENAAIKVLDAADVQIGGPDPTPASEAGNVIVNSRKGIVLERVTGAKIWGNRIGSVDQPILENGISALDVTDLQIGGTRVIESSVEGYTNTLEGIGGHGIEISGASDQLIIQGNDVAAAGKDGIRIDLSAATSVLVGGGDENLRNDVRWSGEWGLHFSGGAGADGPSGVIVAGNYTYMNESGGMLFSQVGDVLIGGPSSEPGEAPGNDVSDGMVVRYATGARIQGNRLYSQSGPDDAPGLYVGGQDVLVGGTAEEEGNLVFGFGTADLADNRPAALVDEGSNTTIQGNVITGGRDGLVLQGYRHSVIDNVISGNAGNGVRVASLGQEPVEIRGNRIGVEKDGMTADPNGAAGILVEAANVQIGGEKSGEACDGPCNVIAGMREDAGIWIGEHATGVTVRGNMIGVGIDGVTPIPNAWGIVVGEDDATIGGRSGAEEGVCDRACNVISGNRLHGIRSGNSETDGVDRLTISGNYIGKTLSGYAGNGLDGISVGGGSVVVIGQVVGFADGTTGNVIATNGGVGVSACGDQWHPQGPQQVTVRGNQTYDNGRLPSFDLSHGCSTSGASDGITMNDPGDTDVGPNGLLNSPTLVAARPAPDGRSLLVLWTGDRDQAPANYQVDVYASSQCRGYSADGRLRVANRTLTFPLSAASDFDTLAITVPLEPADLRHYTATFTDADGNTSEFGSCISAASDPEVIILEMAAGVEVQAPGLLAKLSTSAGKRPTATKVSLLATPNASSSASDSFEETIARSPGGTYIQPQSTVGPTWHLTPADPSPVAHDVCLDASALGDEALDQTVLVTRSPHTGGLWSPRDTYSRTVDGTRYACADGIRVFGHYALGSGASQDVLPPLLLSPESGRTILSTTPYLEWAGVDGASGYDVQIAFDRSFSAILRDTMGIPGPPWIVRDQLPVGSTMHWRVRAIVDAGRSPWSHAFTFSTDPTAVLVEGSGSIPEAFGLTSIYPNPSNGDAQVLFALPEASAVSIQVFDVLGRRVGVVVENSMPAGTHQARFDAASLPSGLYLVRMRSGGFVQTRSVMVVR